MLHAYLLILAVLLGFALGSIYMSFRLHKDIGRHETRWRKRGRYMWWASWLEGMSTELIGAILTTILLVIVIGTYENKVAQERLKELLLYQLDSPDNETALYAVRRLRENGWIEDGTLQGIRLWAADLQNADLRGARLDDAYMLEVNLENASLSEASLTHANLSAINLRGADLRKANLGGAILYAADLEGAYLESANLTDAILTEANLENAVFHYKYTSIHWATLDGVHLPDGQYWSPETIMAIYTDPQYPGFWRSDWLLSPAYGGDDEADR
jgi:hypothetical protein